MDNDNSGPNRDNDLRQRAERIMSSMNPESVSAMSEDEVKALIHDLQVHHIELEMQNEELKSARSQAQELKGKYLDLYDFAPVGYFTFDDQGTILSVNLTGAGLLGVERSLLTGRRFQLFIEESSRVTFTEFLKKVIETSEKQRCEVAVPISGKTIYVQIDGLGVKDPQTGDMQCRASIIDITERNRMLQELRESKENFQAIFDYTPAAVFSYDRQGLILHATPQCEKLFGVPNEQLTGHSMFETVTKLKDHEEIQERLAYVFSGGSIKNIEWQYIRPDGTKLWILTNITPVFGAGGEVMMGLSLNMDITERKLSEQKERSFEEHKLEFYRRLVLAATDGKLVITEREEIEKLAGNPLESWEIRNPMDLEPIRKEVAGIADAAGMEKEQIEKFLVCVGESTSNALKHAGSGTASIHQSSDGLLFKVTDHGPGIEALSLPYVALRSRYSTAGTLGIGYKVIISFSNKVYLATSSEGTTVAMEMKLHSEKVPEFAMDLIGAKGL